jgi:hypothetical protein
MLYIVYTMQNPHEQQPVLHVNITDYKDEETSVAECVEIPVVVEGKDDDEIKKKMESMIDAYFKTFPEKMNEVSRRRSLTIPISR